MAPTPATVPPAADESSNLSTAAIVFIAVGAYMVVFITGVLIRQCLQARGLTLCPEWVNELFCQACCCSCLCITHLAELCDFNVPTKTSCLDSWCPSKEWCDEHFCCCMNSMPGGALCEDCTGPECQCGDCNCACNCNLPECNSINCICFEIQLKQPGGSPGEGGMSGNLPGQPGYYGQYPGTSVAYGQSPGQPRYPTVNPGYA